MNTDWKDPTKDQDYEARKKLSVKAFEAGCVICSNGKFYTPRAFLESDDKVTFDERHA